MSIELEIGIPWNDFAVHPSLQPVSEEFFKSFEDAENLVVFLSAYYAIKGRVPQIRVFEAAIIQAHASHTGDIVISSGVFWRALELQKQLVPHFREIAPKPLNQYRLAQAMVLWVVAHEFFHIAGCHYDALQLHPECREVLEFDADCLACAGIFRSTAHYSPNVDALRAKRFILFALFWPIREMIGSAVASEFGMSTHPPWHLRLLLIAIKIAQMGYQDETPFEGQNAKQHIADLDNMLSYLKQCDIVYCKAIAEVPRKSTFMTFVDKHIYDTYILPILTARYEIDRDLASLSRLTRLRNLKPMQDPSNF